MSMVWTYAIKSVHILGYVCFRLAILLVFPNNLYLKNNSFVFDIIENTAFVLLVSLLGLNICSELLSWACSSFTARSETSTDILQHRSWKGFLYRVLKKFGILSRLYMFQFSKGYREPVERPHIETPQFPGECDPDWPPLGKIYDKKPWKIELEAGKRYSWCSCGHSKNQVSQPAR